MVLGIPWPGINLPILGVVPVLFLMFFVRPTIAQGDEPRNSCSKCASPHAPGQNFCTKCGWDLSRDYTADTADTVLASEMHQPQGSTSATLERPTEPASHESPAAAPYSPEQDYQPAARDDGYIAPDTDGSAGESTDEVSPAPVYASDEAQPSVSESPPAPEEAPRPWGIPVPGPAPTAEGMTARGEVFLSEGKLQEAIDQFTKAIALDPRHREAFEKRAEAYSRQGRMERADEDYRQVQALSTGS